MIIGVGIDVVDIDALRGLAGAHARAARAAVHPARGDLPLESLAARFAAKEALAKALGAPGGLSWHDAEVRRARPAARSSRSRHRRRPRRASSAPQHVHLSLSHDAGIASAFVVLES